MEYKQAYGIDDVCNTVNHRGDCYANVFYDPLTNEVFALLCLTKNTKGYDFYNPDIFLIAQVTPGDFIIPRALIEKHAMKAVKRVTRHPWRSFFVGNLFVFVILMWIGLASQYLPMFIGLYLQYLLSSYIWLFVMNR